MGKIKVHSLSIEELIKRPIIRDDNAYEYLNKMTDVEIEIFNDEIEENLINNNVQKVYPDWNVALLSKMIDFNILYEIFKKG